MHEWNFVLQRFIFKKYSKIVHWSSIFHNFLHIFWRQKTKFLFWKCKMQISFAYSNDFESLKFIFLKNKIIIV